MTGLILSVIWLFAVILMEKKKRTPWLAVGGIVAIALFLYTRQWKLFLWGIAAGVAGAAVWQGCGICVGGWKSRNCHRRIFDECVCQISGYGCGADGTYGNSGRQH